MTLGFEVLLHYSHVLVFTRKIEQYIHQYYGHSSVARNSLGTVLALHDVFSWNLGGCITVPRYAATVRCLTMHITSQLP